MNTKLSILKKIGALTLPLLLSIAAMPSLAKTETQPMLNATIPAPVNHLAPGRQVPSAPIINAEGYVLMDATTGKIITEKNADEQMPPASLTKLMSLYVISQALENGQIQLDDKVRVSKTAWSMDGSKMFLKEGQLVSIEDLLQGIIVDSGNDATVAMAEYIAGGETAFVDMMNQEAERLGMNHSHFADSTGMPNDDHYTTPLDMAILSAALVNHYPNYYKWYSQKWFTFNDIKQPNRNRLLWRYKSADGLKTGHTKEAGYCLAASAKQDGMRLISIMMGAPSDNIRAEGSERLLNYGFRFFKTYKLYSAGDTIVQPKIWKGKEAAIPLGITTDVLATIPRGQYNKLKITTNLNDPLTAPITKGSEQGTLNISLDSQTIAELPLVAMAEVPEGGLWTRMTDSISMAIHDMLSSDDDEEEDVIG